MRSRLLCCAVAAALCVGCENALDGVPVASSVSDAVVGAAAANVSASGLFVLPTPPLRYPTVLSIDSTQARSLAIAYFAMFWNAQPDGMSKRWPKSHGAP